MTPTAALRRAAAERLRGGRGRLARSTTPTSCWRTCSAPRSGRLPLVDVGRPTTQAAAFDALVARRAAREPLQHLTRHRGLPPRRARGRARRLRAAAGDRAARRLGDRRSARAGSSAPGRGRPLHRLGRDRPGGGRRGAATPRCTPSSSTRRRTRWAARNLAGTGVDLRHGDMADGVRRPGRHRRRGRLQPAVHPARGLGVGRARGPRPRPAPGAVLRRRRARRDAGRSSAGAALLLRPGGVVGAEHADVQGESAPAVFAATGRWADVRDHLDLAGRPRFVTARLAR